MRVHLCGVRGSTPAPGAEFLRYGGHTSCIAVAHDGERAPRLLLDAGTGLRTVSALLDRRPFQGTLLLSHLHWDHFQGLPFFASGDHEQARIRVLLPDQGDGHSAIEVLSRAMSPPHFPIGPDELRGSWSFDNLMPGRHSHEGFDVLAREIPHKGGRAFGYRVSDGDAAIAYLPDHCPTDLGAGPEGWGELHPTALELAQGADLLVHDAQLIGERELVDEARFGHSAASYPVELGRAAGVRTVLLFHHRTDRTDDELDALERSFAGERPRVLVARQGETLEL
ncbi:MAG: MBL fold metallo-hydrolase [Solirubrobacteraceae bacterium]